MLAPTPIPENARCRKCGYSLRGLPTFVCPECGRPFDPNDVRTFGTTPPGWRKKRWIKRAAVIGPVAIAIFALLPDGLMQSRVSFTCVDCGQAITVSRYEPRPPRWIPIRYLGLTWTVVQDGHTPHSQLHADCKADLKSDLFGRGLVTAWVDCTASDPCSFNGILVTPVSAPLFLEEMLSPSNTGIGP